MARTATKKSTGARKKPRTAAQKAATAKMLAANKARRAGKSKPASKSRPAAKKRPSYSKGGTTRTTQTTRVTYKKNPVAPRATKESVTDMLLHGIAIPAGIGTGSALAVDALWGNLKFIPVDKRVGKLKYLGKSAIGVGASIGLGLWLPKYRKYTNQIAVGTLIVNGHAAGSEYIQGKFPNLGMGGYDDSELGEAIAQLNGLGEQLLPSPAMSPGLGAFNDIGYYAPA